MSNVIPFSYPARAGVSDEHRAGNPIGLRKKLSGIRRDVGDHGPFVLQCIRRRDREFLMQFWLAYEFLANPKKCRIVTWGGTSSVALAKTISKARGREVSHGAVLSAAKVLGISSMTWTRRNYATLIKVELAGQEVQP